MKIKTEIKVKYKVIIVLYKDLQCLQNTSNHDHPSPLQPPRRLAHPAGLPAGAAGRYLFCYLS